MNTTATIRPFSFVRSLRQKPGLLFGMLILLALIFFEMFNYSTTDYALKDLMGDLKFLGMPWATILAIAFCGIDFAGIARLFTPEEGAAEPKEIWYLLGAWLLAATMNAILTWWGVSMAIMNHATQSTAVIDVRMLTKVVPIFVALMVWVIRILIIGTLSVAGDRIFSSATRGISGSRNAGLPSRFSETNNSRPTYPRPTVQSRSEDSFHNQSEPTYHSLTARGRNTPPRPGGINDPRR
jgi:hypothetical protein